MKKRLLLILTAMFFAGNCAMYAQIVNEDIDNENEEEEVEEAEVPA